jgi:fructose-bisphosphate aldolase class 1
MANMCAHYISALILYADTLEQQIMSCTTAAEVDAIDIASGWPTS